MCNLMASWCVAHGERMRPLIERYQETPSKQPRHLRKALFTGPRAGGVGLLRDLHDLWLAASEVRLSYEALHQAAKALHDKELQSACERCQTDTDRQIAWLRTRIDHAAPQALVVT
jgi:hypothetical protein